MSRAKSQFHQQTSEWSLIPSHTGRKRGFSESTCSSLLSISDSEYSIRTGSTFVGSPKVNRPLPPVPRDEGRTPTSPVSPMDPTSSASRHMRSRQLRHSRQGGTNKKHVLTRRTLVFMCVTSFTLCLLETSLLVAAFFKHGVMPWDDSLGLEVALEDPLACVDLLSRLGRSGSGRPYKAGVGDEAECCSRQFTLMASLVDLLIENQEDSSLSSRCANEVTATHNPVRADVRVEGFTYMPSDRPLSLPLKTGPGQGIKSVSAGVQVETNTMVIIHSGWYLVYLRISSQLDTVQPCGHPQETELMIVKQGHGMPETAACLALSMHKSHCHYLNSTTGSFTTSTTGGTFHLSKGEKILVKISGKKQLKFDALLGAYLLAGSR